MRLTAQVIQDAPTIINPEGQLTIQLRNLKIPYLENLGITNDKFEVIDFTNNELIELGNIPPSFKKLGTLLLANNNITVINSFGSNDLVNLSSISLINNNVQSFADIKHLQNLKSLDNLALLNNPITSHEHYRLFVIWLLPSLKVLDFAKVKLRERKQVADLFGDSFTHPTSLAKSLLGIASNNLLITSKEERQLDSTVKKLTEDDRIKLLHDLESADSIDEIERIESALKNGYI